MLKELVPTERSLSVRHSVPVPPPPLPPHHYHEKPTNKNKPVLTPYCSCFRVHPCAEREKVTLHYSSSRNPLAPRLYIPHTYCSRKPVASLLSSPPYLSPDPHINQQTRFLRKTCGETMHAVALSRSSGGKQSAGAGYIRVRGGTVERQNKKTKKNNEKNNEINQARAHGHVPPPTYSITASACGNPGTRAPLSPRPGGGGNASTPPFPF